MVHIPDICECRDDFTCWKHRRDFAAIKQGEK